MTAPFSIICDWCSKPIKGGNLQMVAAKGLGVLGARRAIFHPSCGAEIMMICETGKPLAAPLSFEADPPPVPPSPAEVRRKQPRPYRKGNTTRRREGSKPVASEKLERPLIDANRVHELAARGHTFGQIAAILRAPYREVESIMGRAA